jgi:hypothetical protein
MEFILAAIVIFTGIKVARSWNRYAARRMREDYAAQMRRIERVNA